jgi:hypothetical protein
VGCCYACVRGWHRAERLARACCLWTPHTCVPCRRR